MLNFNQLRAFFEAARAGSFTRAAEALCVTQPAVTGQVRALEASLGLKLFRRRGRRMVLTEAGALLFREAEKVFALEREIEHLVAEIRDLRRGLLKVGTTKTYARYLMPDILARFHAVHPGIRIVLDEGASAEVLRSVVEGRNELAVVGLWQPVEGLCCTPFRREEVVLFCAPGHPLAGRHGVEVADLGGELLVLKEEGSTTREVVRRLFRRHGVSPNVLVETSNLEFIKDMVARGEGVSFLVRSAIGEELRTGRFVEVPLADGPIRLEVYTVHPDPAVLSPAARAFLDVLEDSREYP
ncbi:MAG: LysR family transcriptional regulator [Candidatus Dadabacteria bacterium]|nr:MAG: LysR family transcriptional regulator [Candidatus Dadabacteria bacterium]